MIDIKLLFNLKYMHICTSYSTVITIILLLCSNLLHKNTLKWTKGIKNSQRKNKKSIDLFPEEFIYPHYLWTICSYSLPICKYQQNPFTNYRRKRDHPKILTTHTSEISHIIVSFLYFVPFHLILLTQLQNWVVIQNFAHP